MRAHIKACCPNCGASLETMVVNWNYSGKFRISFDKAESRWKNYGCIEVNDYSASEWKCAVCDHEFTESELENLGINTDVWLWD